MTIQEPPRVYVQPPIVVSASANKEQLAAGIRQVLLGAAAAATALGASHAAGALSELAVYAGGLATVILFVWGNLKTRHMAKKAAAMANALPDTIAQTR